MTDWLEMARTARARPSDPALDFCKWPYARPAPPQPGALRSEALLYAACAAAGFDASMGQVLERVRRVWGRFGTVWGVKWSGSHLSIELYFYDYARAGRSHGVTDFLTATRPLLHAPVSVDEALPYFMFSVEMAAETLHSGQLGQIDIYMGNPGSSVSSGICYGLTQAGFELRNFYFFFDAVHEAVAAWDKLTESVFLAAPTRLRRDDLVWPEMRGMQTVVVANKRHCDSLYFSRITVDQLAHFLDRLDFPGPIRRVLQENRDLLAHHLYDAGWDFHCDASGRVTPTKGSFYGLF